QAPYALGQAMSVGEIFDAVDEVVRTRLGTWLVVRGIILLAFLVLIKQRILHNKPTYRMVAIPLVVGLFATFSISGHPGMRQFSALSIGTDIVHFLSVSAWMGGLVTMVLLGRKWQTESPDVISWFSFTATISMPIMVATGVAQAWRMMEGFQNIFSTTYSVILSVKVLLVIVAIAAGTRARQLFKSKKVDQQDLREVKFSRTVIAESMIGVAVLAVTSALVSVPPLSVSNAGAFEASVVQANVIADIRVTPARVGEVEVHILFSPPGGALQSITKATARISLVAEEIPAIPIDVRLVGANHFQAALLVPRAGDWLLEIFVNSEPGKSLRFSTVVAIND
ncbi:MAG: copper resistance D family protein, partial [Ilumatobacteraceae bacterium]